MPYGSTCLNNLLYLLHILWTLQYSTFVLAYYYVCMCTVIQELHLVELFYKDIVTLQKGTVLRLT
jgi:hypothetical protein